MKTSIFQYDIPPICIKICETESIEWHKELEIICMIKGSCNIDLGARKIRLEKGKICIVDFHRPHRIYNLSVEAKYISLSIDIFGYYTHLSDNIIGKLIEFNPQITYDNEEYILNTIKESIAEITLESSKKYPNTKKLGSLTESLVLFLSEECDRYGRVLSNYNEDISFRARKVVQFLYSNYQNKITITELAKLVHISNSYLSHKFKDITGYSFLSNIGSIRAEQSIKYLLSSELSITKIAYQCGFSDPKYYNKIFKENMGYTPAQYRKEFAKKYKELKYQLSSNINQVLEEEIKTELNKYKKIVVSFRPLNNLNKIIEIDSENTIDSYDKPLSEYVQLKAPVMGYTENSFAVLEELQKRLKFKYIRLENLIKDEILSNPEHIFGIIDRILSMNVTPLLEVDSKSLSECRLKEALESLHNKYGDRVNEWGLYSYDKINKYGEDIKIDSGSISPLLDTFDDTIFTAPLLLSNMVNSSNVLGNKGFYITLYDEYMLDKGDKLNGSSGLVTFNGIRKPLYYLYFILIKLGKDILDRSRYHIVTKSMNGYQILIFNHVYQPENGDSNIKHTFMIKNTKDKYDMKRYLFSRENNCYIKAVSDDDIKSLSIDEVWHLNDQLKPVVDNEFDNTGVITVDVPYNSIELITLERV